MVDDATFVCFESLSLGLTSCVLSVFVPLKCTCILLVLHSLLNFSLVPLMQGIIMVMFLLVMLWLLSLLVLLLFLVLLLDGLLLKNLGCHWLRAHF